MIEVNVLSCPGNKHHEQRIIYLLTKTIRNHNNDQAFYMFR